MKYLFVIKNNFKIALNAFIIYIGNQINSFIYIHTHKLFFTNNYKFFFKKNLKLQKTWFKKYFIIGLGYEAFCYKQYLFINVGYTHFIKVNYPVNMFIYCKKKRFYIISYNYQNLCVLKAKLSRIKKFNKYKIKGLSWFKQPKYAVSRIKLKQGKKKYR